MKKIYLKLKALWDAETPKIAKFLQVLIVALAAIPSYYGSLPVEFQQTIPAEWIKYVSITSILVAVILQFFKTKTDATK